MKQFICIACVAIMVSGCDNTSEPVSQSTLNTNITSKETDAKQFEDEVSLQEEMTQESEQVFNSKVTSNSYPRGPTNTCQCTHDKNSIKKMSQKRRHSFRFSKP